MKQTITIDIDVRDGYELKYNPETRTIEEVEKEPIRSKSWDEFCMNHPYMQGEWFFDSCGELTSVMTTRRRRTCDITNLATKEDVEGIIALIQLTRLHDEWVGNEKKVSYNSIYWDYILDKINISNNFHHLWFPTLEMAKEFLYCFEDLIKKAKRFI